MEYKKEIIKAIESMSGRYAPYNIFSDWVEMCALSIQNAVSMIHNRIWRQREELYMDLAVNHTSDSHPWFAQAADYLRPRLPRADIAVVLGSGLAELANMLEDRIVVDYKDIRI